MASCSTQRRVKGRRGGESCVSVFADCRHQVDTVVEGIGINRVSCVSSRELTIRSHKTLP